MEIKISVPFSRNRIRNETPRDSLYDLSIKRAATYQKYISLLGAGWEEVICQVASQLGIATVDLIHSPNMVGLIECEVAQRIQLFTTFCGANGYGIIPGWNLVIDNISETMSGFQFTFHYNDT